MQYTRYTPLAQKLNICIFHSAEWKRKTENEVLGTRMLLCEQLLGIGAKPSNPINSDSQLESKQEGQVRYMGNSAQVSASIQQGDAEEESRQCN